MVDVKPSLTSHCCSEHVIPCIVLVCSPIAISLSASCYYFCNSATLAYLALSFLCPVVVLCFLQQYYLHFYYYLNYGASGSPCSVCLSVDKYLQYGPKNHIYNSGYLLRSCYDYCLMGTISQFLY